ncbi:urease accessory protein UreF [Hyphomicrobium sp. 2TAF46]|uniref:urease accessory protein UreF n=1 Tax=Hyphomicrobium sp. 2TAF46 TaxID=3233019 RepID=UPI003F930C95
MILREKLLRTFQHADSQFPSGAFAFSQGLEAFSQQQERLGSFDLWNFLYAQIVHRWASSERIAIIRAYRLYNDLEALAELDAEVEASTISEPLRVGSRRNGMGLLTTHERIGTRYAKTYRGMVRDGKAHGHVAVAQGLLWNSLEIDEEDAVLMSGYQSAASLTTAAIRLGLVGAIDAQSYLTRIIPVIAKASDSPVSRNEPLRAFIPLSEIAISLHGTTGQRLFSN